MTDRTGRRAVRWRAAGGLLPAALAGTLLTGGLAACETSVSELPQPTARSVPPSAAASTLPTATPPAPTATPEPALSLDLPAATDPRVVVVAVTPEVAADGDGRLLVSVTNTSAERVTELVLRWPTALRETLFLAPFAPSEQRLAEGGPPLVQDWTKWVDGPGERGEPAGTTSLGWGPLDAGATLDIPVLVTRRSPGPVAFDLQVLAGEAILTLDGGAPAELRVDVPG